MAHIVSLGDSIFDNCHYTKGGPDVLAQLERLLPAGWHATLLAVDGSTTSDISRQVEDLPAAASHLVLSVGGNDALRNIDSLGLPVTSTAEALDIFGNASMAFEESYCRAVAACLAKGLPLTVGNLSHAYNHFKPFIKRDGPDARSGSFYDVCGACGFAYLICAFTSHAMAVWILLYFKNADPTQQSDSMVGTPHHSHRSIISRSFKAVSTQLFDGLHQR